MTDPALVLFAHGSRKPGWSAPLVRLRDTIAQRYAGPVVLAFAELQPPDLPGAVLDLANRGTRAFIVVPVFFGPGRHVRDDIPAALAEIEQAHPGLSVTVTGTLGEEPTVLAGMAAGILAAAGLAD